MTTAAELSARTWNYWHQDGPKWALELELAVPALIGHPAWLQFQGRIASHYPDEEEAFALLGAPLTPPVVVPEPPIEPEPPTVGLPAPLLISRADRGSREPYGTVNDLKQWNAIKPKSGQRILDSRIFNSDWIALSHAKNDGLFFDFEMRETLAELHKMWIARWYRAQRGLLFYQDTFRNVLNEHACYFNMAGYGPSPAEDPESTFAARWVGCLFQDIGAQALQIVLEEARGKDDAWLRINETPDYDHDATQGGWLSVESCDLVNVGANRSWGRASYALSFFSTRNHVRVCHTTIDASMQTTARGAILLEGVPSYTDVRGVMHHRFPRRALIESVEVTGKVYDRPPLKVHRGIEEFVMRDSTWNCVGGQRDLLIASDTRKVLVEKCDGPGRIIDETGQVLETVRNGYQRGQP